ncbi:conserved exported hypothetical protein [Pantoea brenneri]|uniref:Uncharacterized protein n=1 Tax=Pantoea brenneri TaxID=472694 RepID=A0AAX3J5F1_9GAMM|nr:hypothetical protein [Pantoea brenneri]VXB73722.1 conserved exported hypothetical protein [Pantoea brenneri]
MKWILFIVLAAPLMSHSANKPEPLDFKHLTESACFDPAYPEKQSLCEKSVKIMLLHAASAGYSEAACFSKIVKDKELCEVNSKEYQDVMRYSMK